jgi:hypothetical protein
MGTDGQGAFAGRLHTCLAMVAGQTHQAQAGAIALFRMFLLHHEALDQFGGGWPTDAAQVSNLPGDHSACARWAAGICSASVA